MSGNFFALKTTLYMWAAFIVVALILFLVKITFNIDHIPSADLFILVLSPYIASVLFKKKMNLPLPENVANKLASYFVISYLIVFYIILFVYISGFDAASISKLSEHTATLVISLIVMSLGIFYLGRLVVIMNLIKKTKT